MEPTEQGCLEWQGPYWYKIVGRQHWGHWIQDLYVGLWRDPDGTNRLASMVAYEEKYGPNEEGYWLFPECRNPKCVNPEHQHEATNPPVPWAGVRAVPVGLPSPRRSFTDEEELWIKELHEEHGFSNREIHRRLVAGGVKVSLMTVNRAVKRAGKVRELDIDAMLALSMYFKS